MKHYVKIYPGKYEIKTSSDSAYIYQAASDNNPRYYRFDTPGDREEIMRAILELNPDNEKEILDFHRSYGLLVNTLNDPEKPTYCGRLISPETNLLISPFTSGIALQKYFFKFFVELLKNIFSLSTEISLYHQKGDGYDEEQNATKMLGNFLTLLFQPYIIKDAPKIIANPIIDGPTPLSRFAFHYHNAFQSSPGAFSSNMLRSFASAFSKLATENYKAIKNIPAAPPELKDESDIPTFSPPKHFKINPLVVEVHIEFSDTFYDDTATFDYSNLSYLLYSICQYCNFSFDKDGTLNLSFTNKDAFLSNAILIKLISVIGKNLIMETINTYTESIHFELKLFDEDELSSGEYEKYKASLQKNSHNCPKEYLFTYQSSCLLQSLFLITAEMLNEYGVSTCKYPDCKKPFFYKLARPKSCCCHKHTDNYSKLKKETLLNCIVIFNSNTSTRNRQNMDMVSGGISNNLYIPHFNFTLKLAYTECLCTT